jgi:hypothetical protein
LAVLFMTGHRPKEVDHKNRLPDDNTWSNLREATRSQNCVNRHRKRTKNHGLPRGVYIIGGSIASQIVVNKKRIYLGTFKTVSEAKAVYDAAASEHFGEFLPSSELPVAGAASVASGQEDIQAQE